MNAMTILRRCRAAKDEIERLQQRIDQWQEVLGRLNTPMDPNGGSRGGGNSDRIAAVLADVDLLEREIAARKEAEEVETVAAMSLLKMIPDLESKILYDYYVKRWDTPDIARHEKYTYGYVRKAKRGGEKLLEMLSEARVRSVLPAWYLKKEEG